LGRRLMPSWTNAEVGDRVVITGRMYGERDPLPVGARGTIDYVGAGGSELSKQLGVQFDSGRNLLLLPFDPFYVIKKAVRK
jgi:hypothetical protein